jgi:hypothetical protein
LSLEYGEGNVVRNDLALARQINHGGRTVIAFFAEGKKRGEIDPECFIFPGFQCHGGKSAVPFLANRHVILLAVLGEKKGEPGMLFLVIVQDEIVFTNIGYGDEEIHPLIEKEIGSLGLGRYLNLGHRRDSRGQKPERAEDG